MFLTLDPSFQCINPNLFQVPVGAVKTDRLPIVRETSSASLASRGRGAQSDGIIKIEIKISPLRDSHPLVLLMNQGDSHAVAVALYRCRNFDHLRAQRRGYKTVWQIPQRGIWDSTWVTVCYCSVRSSGHLHLGCSTDSVVVWLLKRHFRRHGLIVEMGTIWLSST